MSCALGSGGEPGWPGKRTVFGALTSPLRAPWASAVGSTLAECSGFFLPWTLAWEYAFGIFRSAVQSHHGSVTSAPPARSVSSKKYR